MIEIIIEEIEEWQIRLSAEQGFLHTSLATIGRTIKKSRLNTTYGILNELYINSVYKILLGSLYDAKIFHRRSQ